LNFIQLNSSFVGAAIGSTVAGQSGVAGSWSYQLNSPSTVIYDQYGYLYIMDAGNERIQCWIPGATYGITIASTNTMNTPRGMHFDSYGNLAVTDEYMHRVISFAMLCRKYIQKYLIQNSDIIKILKLKSNKKYFTIINRYENYCIFHFSSILLTKNIFLFQHQMQHLL
jgi:hypothetical protein